MINLPQGFHIGAPEAVDARFALTLQEMKAMNDTLMPEVYFTICKDDNNIYVYNKENEPSSDTGRFRLYKAGTGDGSEPIDIEKIKILFDEEEI